MIKVKYLTIIFMILSVCAAFGGVNSDFVTVNGRIYKFNKKYVYLKSRHGKVVLLRKYFSDDELKNTKKNYRKEVLWSDVELVNKYLKKKDANMPYYLKRIKKRRSSL